VANQDPVADYKQTRIKYIYKILVVLSSLTLQVKLGRFKYSILQQKKFLRLPPTEISRFFLKKGDISETIKIYDIRVLLKAFGSKP